MVVRESNDQTVAVASSRGRLQFYLIFLTQTMSLFSSSTAAFSLRVLLYQTTLNITSFTRLTLVCMLPRLLLWPLAGSLADRYSRKTIMVVCDLIACAATFVLYLESLQTSTLNVSTLYLVAAVISIANAIQSPCFEASIVTLVDPEFLSRANGLIECASGFSALLSPLLSCLLVELYGMDFLLAADLICAGLAIISLLLADIPLPTPSD